MDTADPAAIALVRDLLNPRIFGIRVSMLFHLYRRRLRSHLAQELLAGSGIAVAVALVFGVLVANTSLTSSAGALIQQVIGSARVQLTARSPAGFDQRLAGTVGRSAGRAAPRRRYCARTCRSPVPSGTSKRCRCSA